MSAHGDDTIEFATRLLELVHRAETTTSYKYALLIALIELAVEDQGGSGNGVITTRQLAARALELYWQQARPFHGDLPLRQLGGRGRSIVDRIARFRRDSRDVATPQLARTLDESGYLDLLDEIEWLLIRNPIPRLQRLGKQSLDLLYEAPWPEEPAKKPVSAYQRALRDEPDGDGFDNRIRLHAGVGAKLARLAPLFLPLIRREWARFVARHNKDLSDAARLEDFLFTPGRERLAKLLRAELVKLQDRRCFYCDDRLHTSVEVDHFLAWSRCGASAIDNLVAAHAGCNGDKSDLLVSARHLERWIERLDRRRDELREIAERRCWYADPRRVGALVRASYERVGDETPLWVARQIWVPAKGERLGPQAKALARVLRGL